MEMHDTVQTITLSRSALLADTIKARWVQRQDPPNRNWRADDPPVTTVGELTPDDFGKRVIIRSGNFLGTVYGTLLGVYPHPSLVHFTSVQLYGKKILTFRNDMETLVVDETRARVA